MKRLLPAVLLLLPLGALGDEFHTLVTYTCDAKADQLTVEYKGAYNEAGERLKELKGLDAWVPGELRGLASNDPIFAAPKTVVRRCTLSDGAYELHVKPTPEDFRNVQGRCGDWETVKVRVLREQRAIADLQFDQSCYNWSAPVITKLVVRGGQAAPTVVQVSSDDFHK